MRDRYARNSDYQNSSRKRERLPSVAFHRAPGQRRMMQTIASLIVGCAVVVLGLRLRFHFVTSFLFLDPPLPVPNLPRCPNLATGAKDFVHTKGSSSDNVIGFLGTYGVIL